VESLVSRVVEDVELLQLDGVDLTQDEACGSNNLNCEDQVSQQLLFLELLRQALPKKIITYTFPGRIDNYPFRLILKYGWQYLDAVTAYRATGEDMEAIVDLGIPKEKVLPLSTHPINHKI